jgi:hypothetical protein
MWREMILHAIHCDGTDRPIEVLEPLFRTLQPAFAHQAAEIKLSRNGSEQTAEFTTDDSMAPLRLDPGYHHSVAASRLKIISALSIAPQARQTGYLCIRFGETKVPVEIEVTNDDQGETLVLRPVWNGK